MHPGLFALVTAFIVFLAVQEFRQMFNQTTLTGYLSYIISLFFLGAVLLIYYYSSLQISLLLLLFLFIIVQIIAVYRSYTNVKEYLTAVSFALLYIVLPLYLLNVIHRISLHEEVFYSLAIFILIWTNDTFAYLTGMAIGRHKLFERISPKKSWEGFFGGLIMTLAGSFLLCRVYPALGMFNWLLFGLLTSIASVFGDFIESIIKRSVHVKDSGSILPGHGGILDRIDSLLLVSPVIYIYLEIILK